MTKFKTIKFRKEFIQGILHGKKTATTRLKRKPFGVYQVISVGDRGKQTLLQLFIEIQSVLSYKVLDADTFAGYVVKAENFRDWKEYHNAMCEIYGQDPAIGFKRRRTFHTHFFVKVENIHGHVRKHAGNYCRARAAACDSVDNRSVEINA